MPGADVVPVSAKTGAGLDELRAALAARRGAGGSEPQSRRPLPALRRPRLHAARDRHGRDRNALDRLDRRRRHAAGRAGGPRRPCPQRPGARPRRRARRGRPARRRQPARRRAAPARRGDALVEPDGYPVELPARRRARRAGVDPDGARLHVHHGTARIPARLVRVGDATPSSGSRRPSSPRAATASCCGRRRRSAAAPCSTRPRRARDDADRLERRRGAATIRSPVHEPVRARRWTARHSASSQASCAPATGCSRRRGSTSCAPSLARRLAAADPLDPGIPPPTAPWAAAVEPLLGLERRGAKLYAPGATAVGATRRGRRTAREELEPRASSRCASTTGRWRRTSSARAASSASATASRERGRLRAGPAGAGGGVRARRRITLARLRDLLGTRRRSAQLLLERFDADGLTRRVGDERVLRRRATP